MRQILENCWEQNRDVQHRTLWRMERWSEMHKLDFSKELVNLCRNLNVQHRTLWRMEIWSEMHKLDFSKELVNLCRNLNNEI